MPRLKKLTDYTYSPTNPASEDAIRAQIDDSIQEVYDAAAKATDTVNLTGDQTVAGVKTFASSPVVPVASANENPIRKDTFETHKTSADHDGRYYTESEVNALLLANQQGNHTGTWQGYSPTLVDPGIAGVVAEHTAQLAEKVPQIEKANALNPIFIETYDGFNQVVHPDVLYFPTRWNNNQYWMAYTPYPGSLDQYENPCIAISNDGVRWFTPTGLTNPLATPTQAQLDVGGHYSDTDLVYRADTNTLECWYRYNVNGVTEKILRRTTTDGATWTPEETIMSNDGSHLILSPALIFENGKYKMWYVKPNDIMYTESADAITWTTPVSVTLTIPLKNGDTPWHLDVVRTDLGYEMLLNVNTTAGVNNKKLLCGLSPDGLSWGEFKPCINPSGNVKAFDSRQIYRSTFVKINGIYYVYYSALSARGTFWNIGLSTGKSLDKLVGDYTETQDNLRNTFIPRNLIMRRNAEIELGINGAKYTERSIKLVNNNFAGLPTVELKPTDMLNTMDVVASNGTDRGFMRMAGIQFGNGTTPSNLTDGMLRWFLTEKKLKLYQLSPSRWFMLQTNIFDTTANRPTTNLEVGQQYFDTTLNKPIWRNAANTGWVDASGNAV